MAQERGLTISGRVQDNEARIDGGLVFPIPEIDGVRVASQAICGLVDVDIMVCPVQSPQSSNARRTTADDCNFLPGDQC